MTQLNAFHFLSFKKRGLELMINNYQWKEGERGGNQPLI